MASGKYNIFSAIETNSGGTAWHKVGVAFQNKGKGMTLAFNSLPLPNKEGKVLCQVFEDEPRQAQGTLDYGKHHDTGEPDGPPWN